MTGKRILIVYSGLYGYVEEISREMVRILEENGLNVHLVNLKKTRKSRWPYIGEYDGILVGSSSEFVRYAISRYGPRKVLRKDPKNFLKTNINEIVQSYKILGVFRSDPFDVSVILNPEPAAIELEELIVKKLGFKPSICAWFGPVINLKHKKIIYEVRKRLRQDLKSMSRETGLEFDLKGYNDFRDWDRIQEFTLKFAGMVDSSIEPTSTEPRNQCPNCGNKVDPSWKFCVNCNHKLK